MICGALVYLNKFTEICGAYVVVKQETMQPSANIKDSSSESVSFQKVENRWQAESGLIVFSGGPLSVASIKFSFGKRWIFGSHISGAVKDLEASRIYRELHPKYQLCSALALSGIIIIRPYTYVGSFLPFVWFQSGGGFTVGMILLEDVMNNEVMNMVSFVVDVHPDIPMVTESQVENGDACGGNNRRLGRIRLGVPANGLNSCVGLGANPVWWFGFPTIGIHVVFRFTFSTGARMTSGQCQKVVGYDNYTFGTKLWNLYDGCMFGDISLIILGLLEGVLKTEQPDDSVGPFGP
ncbi:hypothetical protein V8G54_032903 [Vigna mungo]|uniref:Uncharacterized protein n=1 Tax=Vigna mungo TaxID=3915 RepID=A0AAQ3MMU5_VIGMU